jgi:hypothetical protein
MKFIWHTPYKSEGNRYPDPVWPEGWPPPSVDEIVVINKDPLWVRAVEFNPFGDDEDPEPFIYVVLADRPR